jgi:DNA-directed RNA polymerase specialized sigma24 family protein
MDREISAILDIPMGTVAVKYARIRNKLREKYEKLG